MSGTLFIAAHALGLIALAATAWVAGRLALRAVGAVALDAGAALATALGLAILASLGAGLGALHRLDRSALLLAGAVVHLAGLGVWRAAAVTGAAWARSAVELARERARLVPLALGAAVAAVFAAPFFVLALYPPTAFDETLYHLPTARAFVEAGSLPFLPELRFPVFPHLGEVLAAEVLALGGDTATHRVSLLAVGLTAALLWRWGRAWGSGERPATAGIAAALWLGNPIVAYLGGTGYVEPLLALFVTAAGYAFWSWRRDGGRGWLVLAAACAGAAAGTKYLGLFPVAWLAAGVLVLRAPAATLPGSRSPRRRLADLGLFLAVAGAVLAPWYGRILALTGNPLFPYLSGIFGENDWTPIRFYRLEWPAGAEHWLAGAARGAGRLVTLPWDVVARRHLVGGLPPFSPVFVLGLPLLLWAAVRDRPLRWLLSVVLAFALVFLALPPDARYLVPVLPVVSLGLALALGDVARGRRWPHRRAALAALALAIALPGWLYACHRLRLQGPPPSTPLGRNTYLRQALPPYAAVTHVNEMARMEKTAPLAPEARPAQPVGDGSVAYGLHLESMRYYVDGTFYGDWYGPRRYELLRGWLTDPATFHATLAGWDVDYLLAARSPEAAAFLERAARESAGFERVFQDPVVLVYAVARNGGGNE